MILKFLQRIWNDPVGSKVIAAGIIASLVWLSAALIVRQHNPLLFKSDLAYPYEYQLEEDPVGRGTLTVQGDLITLLRTNKEGKVKVRLKKYLYEAGKMDFIKSDVSGNSMRVLHVSMECRVIGGKHGLGVIVSGRDGSCITSELLDVTGGDWDAFQIYLADIPATEDLIIEFEDAGVERANSCIQLRYIKIEEVVR